MSLSSRSMVFEGSSTHSSAWLILIIPQILKISNSSFANYLPSSSFNLSLLCISVPPEVSYFARFLISESFDFKSNSFSFPSSMSYWITSANFWTSSLSVLFSVLRFSFSSWTGQNVSRSPVSCLRLNSYSSRRFSFDSFKQVFTFFAFLFAFLNGVERGDLGH